MALLIFVMIFVGVLAYVFLGLRDRSKIDEMAGLPFVPENQVDTEFDSEINGRDASAATEPTEDLQDGRTR